jgi:hypothetical protein
MLRKKVLINCLVFGFMVVGLGACNNDYYMINYVGDDATINRRSFLKLYAHCDETVPADQVIACVTNFFDLKVDEHCAEKGMSSAHQKCVRLHNQIKVQVALNAMKNLEEAKSAANANKK